MHREAVFVKINFQPSTSVVPPGYLADVSLPYGDRGNGYTYGWNEEFDETRDRLPGIIHVTSTINHMQYDNLTGLKDKDRIWEIEVPNGQYTVKIIAGDYDLATSTDIVAEEGT